ncbi:hypothetical protein E2C01_006755 [Portunus trituberculatus]|uniref:Uncharacterized protein n=1 Tax=Portunus trituberculatus TaxID=210409 RepID=A0A5B7CW78_PORTR|nr:hypothetical protein [Portunus trituberculatus]
MLKEVALALPEGRSSDGQRAPQEEDLRSEVVVFRFSQFREKLARVQEFVWALGAADGRADMVASLEDRQHDAPKNVT